MNQRANDATVQITTLRVTGIQCGDCAVHLRRALEGIHGVVHIDVHQGQTEIVLEHLPTFVDAAAIAASIRQHGYGVEVHATVPDFASGEGASDRRQCCARKDENSTWWNLGTSTIG